MLISEVCRQSHLTRKAIEYYVEQHLIQPDVRENGYRDFSDRDLERLKKISVLRRLNVPVQHIPAILDGNNPSALRQIAQTRQLAIEAEQTRQTLIQQLAEKQDWQAVSAHLDALEARQTILQRISNAFPGAYGQYLLLHFGRYLNEPVASAQQQEAFETVIQFLDNVTFELPSDLAQYFDEAACHFDEAFVKHLDEELLSAACDPERYLSTHWETLEQYMQFRQSEAFQASPAGRLQACLQALNRENGYDIIFIPAMRRLSARYRAYSDALKAADQAFANRYPAFAAEFSQSNEYPQCTRGNTPDGV